MNTRRIEKLSTQVNSLDSFHKRCLWADVVFSIDGYSLDTETTALIKVRVHEVVDKVIEVLETEIKKEIAK